jgi:hypothetical protein|tara:strand:+ start:886 stop:1326 length:441 start_codon:yes stop_codon:yes gene_type:complete
MKKLVAVVLLFSFPAFTSELVIEGIQEGQKAPFSGIIMDADTAAKVIAEREYEIKKCDIKIEHEKKKKDSLCDLKTGILDAKLKAEEEKNDAITKIKTEEIERLTKALEDSSADYSEWWFVGGFFAGIVASIGVFYAAVKTSQGEV